MLGTDIAMFKRYGRVARRVNSAPGIFIKLTKNRHYVPP